MNEGTDLRIENQLPVPAELLTERLPSDGDLLFADTAGFRHKRLCATPKFYITLIFGNIQKCRNYGCRTDKGQMQEMSGANMAVGRFGTLFTIPLIRAVWGMSLGSHFF